MTVEILGEVVPEPDPRGSTTWKALEALQARLAPRFRRTEVWACVDPYWALAPGGLPSKFGFSTLTLPGPST